MNRIILVCCLLLFAFTTVKSVNAQTAANSSTITSCNTYYWSDSGDKNCNSKSFCGAFMYRDLKIFNTREACLADLGSTTPINVYASLSIPSTPSISLPAPVTENVPDYVNTSMNLTYLKARGKLAIDWRLTSLDLLKFRLNSFQPTADQKSSLIAAIDDRHTSLSALKNQINAGTDLETVRGLVKSIYNDYRIYAIFIPKINLEKNIYLLSNHLDRLQNDTLAKIQARISAAQAKGVDVSAKQAALDKATSQLAQIKSDLQALLDEAAGLTPADYPTSYKQEISTVKTDLQNLRQELKGYSQALAAAKVNVPKK